MISTAKWITTMIVIFFLPLSFLHAAMYKWKDEHGNTHYTSSPPPSGNAKVIKEPRKLKIDPKKALENIQNKDKEFLNRRKNKKNLKESNKQLSAKKKNDETQKKNCEVYKQSLKGFQDTRNDRYIDKDGSAIYMDGKIRQQQIKNAQKMIKEYCR